MNRRKVALLIIMITAGLTYAQPDWSINPREYVHSMTVIAQLNIECTYAPNDLLVAAFNLAGEIRGVTSTQSDGFTFITIHSNVVNEQLVLQCYRPELDSIFYLSHPSVTFIPDRIVGSISSPMSLAIYQENTTDHIPPLMQIYESDRIPVQGIGTGYWQLLKGSDGYFIDEQVTATIFHGSIGHEYLVRWTQVFADSCLNQHSYSMIHFVQDAEENQITTCHDGLDNDGDGLIDCLDPDCSRPVITHLHGIPPTTQSCSSTDLNGLITVEAEKATTYSLNLLRFNNEGIFDALDAADYTITAINQTTMCSIDTSVLLPNTKHFYAENRNIVLDCELHADTILQIETFGGTPPIHYSWQDSAGAIISNDQRIGPGMYRTEITDDTGCKTTAELAVYYQSNELEAIDLNFTGPAVVCPSSSQVYYELGSNYGRQVRWSISDQAGQIQEIDPKRISIDYSNNFNSAIISASTSNHCGVRKAELTVNAADATLCQALNDCYTGLEINGSILNLPLAPQYYATQGYIRLKQVHLTKSLAFSTKDYFEMLPDVEISEGVSVEVNFDSCHKD